MTQTFRRTTSEDKLFLSLALDNVGIKARIRVFATSIRIVFNGDAAAVASVLNSNGYRFASGRPFEARNFQSPSEVHVPLALP